VTSGKHFGLQLARKLQLMLQVTPSLPWGLQGDSIDSWRCAKSLLFAAAQFRELVYTCSFAAVPGPHFRYFLGIEH
jgi:hypothetical protein